MSSVGGVTVSMVAFQAVDPGSTPGRRIIFFLYDLLLFQFLYELSILSEKKKRITVLSFSLGH